MIKTEAEVGRTTVANDDEDDDGSVSPKKHMARSALAFVEENVRDGGADWLHSRLSVCERQTEVRSSLRSEAKKKKQKTSKSERKIGRDSERSFPTKQH